MSSSFYSATDIVTPNLIVAAQAVAATGEKAGKSRLSCFNNGHLIEDYFVDITEMVAIGCPLK